MAHSQFFDQLPFAGWVKPLQDAGVFKCPLEPIREGNYISFPIWPQAAYLSRMAKIAPKDVLDAILRIPFSENLRVHEDLVDAALSMPADLTVKWAEHELVWLKKQQWLYLRLPEKLGDLVRHLISGNQIEVAFETARILLSLKRARKTKKDKNNLFPKPRAIIDVHDYERVLKQIITDLVKADAPKALSIFIENLKASVLFSTSHSVRKSGADGSYVWRPRIDHQRRNYSDFRELWVSAVRYVCEEIIKNDPSKIKEIVTDLFKCKPPLQIFKRIALHLLEAYPGSGSDLIKEQLLNKNLFARVWSRNEYNALLRSNFKNLEPDNQQKILGWIQRGADTNAIRHNLSRISGKKPSDKLVNYHADKWQLECLHPIKENLPPDWKQKYDRLSKKHGVVEPQDEETHGRTWVGPTSPKSVGDLEAMTTDDLAAYLKNWVPSNKLFSPSMEGLGRVLKEVIAKDPKRYASEAAKFIGLDPTYIRAIFSAFQQVATNKGVFKWDDLLRLATWAVSENIAIPGRVIRERIPDRDADWQPARQVIAKLIGIGLAGYPAEIPFNFANEVWALLKSISDDNDPKPEDEKEDLARGCEILSLALNYTRPEAINSAILYAGWVKKHSANTFNLNAVPEVRNLLEKHLDPSKDPSLVVHSIYGSRFPFLVHLDNEWAKQNKNKIFNEAEINSTWIAYIKSNEPYRAAFELIKDLYKLAVETISEPYSDEPKEYAQSLTEHLMIFNWLGWISFGSADGILDSFYKKATISLKSHALHFIGRSLFECDESPPQDMLARVKALWESRLQVLAGMDDDNVEELTSFGWWFLSSKFEDEWSIQQLLNVLKITGKAEGAHLVLEKLESLMQKLPSEVLQCLEFLINGVSNNWEIRGWNEEIRSILTIAIGHQDDQIKKEGIRIVNLLAAFGHAQFNDLLPNIDGRVIQI